MARMSIKQPAIQNPYLAVGFQFAVIKNGQVLYEKDKENRLKYEEYIIKRNVALKYLYDQSFKRFLERIG